MAITLSIIFVLLLLSAFFSSSETALTAVSRPLMHRLEKNGDKRAVIINSLLKKKERLIGSLLIGNNLVNITASALATSFLISIFGETGVFYATIAMTIMIVIFSEVIPKTYAIRNSDNMALRIAWTIKVVVTVFSPLTHAINFISITILKLLGANSSGKNITGNGDDELRGAIDLHEGGDQETVKHERAMLRSVLDLAEVKVVEIMTHRKNTISVDAGLPAKQNISTILDSPYTRVPVWIKEPDNIVGVLHAKELLRDIQSGTSLENVDIAALSADPWFIPEQTLLLDQLQAFRQRCQHFALIVDEYGSLTGIVTLEDIIEEIIGDIDDEHDVISQNAKREADGSLIVEGKSTIRDLNREFEWGLPDEEAITIAGLIINESRRIPEAGKSIVFQDFRFDILECTQRQITSVRITPPEKV
jgi:Mg2+/Co2+ transporter CorB